MHAAVERLCIQISHATSNPKRAMNTSKWQPSLLYGSALVLIHVKYAYAPRMHLSIRGTQS